MRWQRGRVGCLAGMVVVLGVAGGARADVSTEKSASILVFPKVIADGTRDTIIQISNTSNQLVHAHCFYVNGALTDPTQPQGPFNTPLWQEIDFDLTLTKQQPTHWFVSEGRLVNPLDEPCSPTNLSCDEAGFDPGRIPPVVPDFRGELKCVEVDDSGAPLSGNHLKGEATLVQVFFDVPLPFVDGEVTAFPGDLSGYNAIGILGSENNGDGTLVLGGGQCVGEGELAGAVCTTDDSCGDAAPCALEYNACPQTWILNHAAQGAPDLVLNKGGLLDTVTYAPTAVNTELTIVPCTENFETQQQTTVTLQFVTTNEFESQFSVSTSITCWGNFEISDLGAPALTFAGQQVHDPLGSMYLQTRIRSAEGTPYGVLMVAEETHIAPDSHSTVMMGMPIDLQVASRAAVNLHIEGERSTPDVITIPDDQLVP